ncbi:MAG: hypothetical protein ACOYY3_18610 [Chloroflexota bacterium]
MIVIWPEPQEKLPPQWRGAIETVAGERFYFRTLTDLNRLVGELGGWMDPPPPRPAGDEN